MDVDDGPAKPAANGEAAPSSGARPVDVVSGGGGEEDTLPGVVRGFVDGVWSAPGGDEPLLRRLKAASCEAAPRLRGASRNSARDLLEWTRRGSGLRAILVISVGTITLIALTGLLIFMFFLLVATANAVIVSVLMSLAAAGGFLAIFFACLVAVYVGAVSVAVFAISATVISAIVGVMIATGVSRRASAKTPGMQTFSLRKGGRPAAVSRIPPRITSRQLAPACVGRRRSSGKEADEEGARGGGCCRRRGPQVAAPAPLPPPLRLPAPPPRPLKEEVAGVLRLRAAGLLRLDGRICEARPRPAPPAEAEAEERGAAERGARRRPSATDGGGRALTRARRIEEAAAEVVAVPRRRSLRRTARRPSVLALRSPRASADRIELAPPGPRSAAALLWVYVRAGPWLPSESTARAEERAPEGGGRLRRERGAGETMGEGSGWVQRGAVGMRHPQDCATGRSACKMQRALQTPLELLQWPLLPHFGDAAPFAHTAGVSLRRYFILDILKGWVGFFWMIWFAARKSMDLTKHSIGATTSAIQSYSASRNANWKPAD